MEVQRVVLTTIKIIPSSISNPPQAVFHVGRICSQSELHRYRFVHEFYTKTDMHLYHYILLVLGYSFLSEIGLHNLNNVIINITF